jgi:hypothetical protein
MRGWDNLSKKLNLKWVTDIIGDEYKNWKNGDVIKIQAQTGTGKTFFITGDKEKKGLIDYADIRSERVLYLCNRSNLKKQIKIDLLKKYDMDIPYLKTNKGKYKLDKSGKKIVDETALEKITKIKNIVISSYHAIQNSRLESDYTCNLFNLDSYNYIICDECHYILADASFCNKTRFAYYALLKEHCFMRKTIFISATMEFIEPLIDVIGEKYIGRKPQIYNYTTGTDYSYVNVKYFKNDTDIIKTINNDKTDNKWLVFVSNLEVARHLQEEIKDSNIVTATYSDSKTKTNIIQNSKFECRVVIATKALDNGVNFTDERLKNIVIYSWDRVTFIQELGRKRVRIEDAQEVNLYIKHRWSKAIKGKLNNISKKEELLDMYKNDILTFNYKFENAHTKVPEELFYVDEDGKNSAYQINEIGEISLLKNKEEFEKTIQAFKEDKEHAYIKEQLKWINLEDTFSIDNYIEEVILDEEIETLEKYIETVVDKKLFNNEQQKISDLIIRKLTTIGDKVDYRTEKLKPSTLETILRDQLNLQYAISKSTKETKGEKRNKNYIIITKLQQ